MTDALDQKLIDAFPGKVVRKDLVRKFWIITEADRSVTILLPEDD